MSVFTIPSIVKAAALALIVGGTTFAAVPVQAASPSIEFNFSIGNGGSHWNHGKPNRHCMADRQVRRDLRQDGYDHIRFFDRRGRIVQVTASLGRRDFKIAYDTCRGRIVDRDRVGRR